MLADAGMVQALVALVMTVANGVMNDEGESIR